MKMYGNKVESYSFLGTSPTKIFQRLLGYIDFLFWDSDAEIDIADKPKNTAKVLLKST